MSEVRPAAAGCNVIPPAVRTFRGTVGTIDRPFARPGDWVTLSLNGDCAAGAPSFPETAAVVVTFVFTPPGHGSSRMVTLTERCEALAATDCSVPSTCMAANGANDPIMLERLDPRTLRFRFPDTDTLFHAPDDDRTLAGPATITVTAVDEPLPCAIATTSCAQSADGHACIDALYATNGSCNGDPEPTFPHFTALPPPNNYAALCSEPAFPLGPCTGTGDEIRFTIDAVGNVLLPMDWRGVRVDRDAVPVARLLRASSNVEAFPGGGSPVQVADFHSLGAYSPEGLKLPPLFDPQQNPADETVTTFFGSTDAAETVLRVARGATCRDGINRGIPCGDDRDCPQSTCTPGLFDFASRLLDGAGPAVIRLGACFGGPAPLSPCIDDASCNGGQCAHFDLVALDPVPLDGLNQSEQLNALVLEEAIPDPPQDFNGDGDTVDHVIKLGARSTGLTQAIGINGSEGRAIARVRQDPFTFPALAAEEDLVAFLEPESLQNEVDANDNQLVFDTILRAYRISPSAAADLSPSPAVAADAEPIVDGRSVATSDGRVFFRRAERDGAPTVATEEIYFTPPDTALDGAFFFVIALSDDGRYAVIQSDAAQLVPNDTNNFCDSDYDGASDDNCSDLFVYDRVERAMTRVSVGSDGTEGNGPSFIGAVSPSARFVAFNSDATNLDPADPSPGSFIHDRQNRTTTRVPLPYGVQALSEDGQSVLTLQCDPIGPFTSRCEERVLDRRTGEISTIGLVLGALDVVTLDFPIAGTLSADGRIVTFWSDFADPVHGTGEGQGGIFAHDRVTGITTRVSVATDGAPANGLAYFSALSRDGRFVAFDSPATNLTAGDTNGEYDLYVHDRSTGFTSRINVTSYGEQAGPPHLWPSFSNAHFGVDGRRVYFSNVSANLAPADRYGSYDFVHDRLTGQTARIPRTRPLAANEWDPLLFGISADERLRAFSLCTSISSQPNCRPGLRFEAVDEVRGDLTGDGDANDTVLSVLDSASGSVTTVCPANAVSIADSSAAFLRPESAGVAPALESCPAGVGDEADLNSDGDTEDQIVHLWRPGAPARNLQRAARAVSLSANALAALVSEHDDGSSDLNGDGDIGDDIVQVFAADRWINVAQAADKVQAAGPVVAFTTPEANQAGTDLNADGDSADRVVQIFTVDDATLVNTGQAAEDFVVGASGLVAFRTREASQADDALNGDGDSDDDVLQVYDPATGQVLNTGLAVTPCMLEACDPRAPYRVLNDTVKFLTFESAQGADLNGDGDQNDLVVQVVNVRQACHSGSMAGACHALAAATAGICTNNGQACASDANCGGGTCFVPPGGCIRDLETPCTLSEPQPCGEGRFCQPTLGTPGVGTCQQREGACREDTDCTAPATCSDGGQVFNRLVDPLKQQNGGAAVFTAAGQCVEDLGIACQSATMCAAGTFCDAGTCRREHGSCARDADCPTGAVCRQDMVQATAEDRDGDELPDAFDNCPDVANIMQEDGDTDGVGDACAVAVDDPSNGASKDDGCALVPPRSAGAVGWFGWALPAMVAFALGRKGRVVVRK